MTLDQSPESRSARKERLARLLANPETMDTIYEHIANGGTLINLAETWDVPFSHIMRWIDDEPARQKKFRDAVQARNEWSDEMLLAELRAMARFDIRKLYDDKGCLLDISALDAQTARLVSSVEVDDIFEGRGAEREKVGETKKVKLWDKLKAIEMHMKNRRLLVDKVEMEGSIKLEDLVGRSMTDPPPPAAVAPTPAPVQAAKEESSTAEPVLPAPAPAPEVPAAPAAMPETPAQ